MATIGVSTESGVVRGVLLADNIADSPDSPPRVLNRGERDLVAETDPATAAAVASVLDALEAELGPDEEIDATVVSCHTSGERTAIESRLADGRWSSSSLVTADSALLATVKDMPDLDDYATLLVYEVIYDHKALSVVDAGRTEVLASDTATGGDIDAGAIGASVSQAWSLLDSIDAKPDAVVLLGASADEPEVAPVLELGFGVPVILAPELESAEAIGAALIARDTHEAEPASTEAAPLVAPVVATPTPELVTEPEPEEPTAVVATTGRSNRKRVVAVAAAAALVGLGTLGATQLLAGSAAGTDSTTLSAAQLAALAPSVDAPTPAAAAPAAPVPTPAAGAPADPARVDAAPATPDWTQPNVAPAPATPWPADNVPNSVAPQQPASAPVAPRPQPAPPLPAKVGAPNAIGLFPGEGPPPPLGSDPRAIEQWWEHHGQLKDRWLHGG
ncbi:hypothetical protein JGU71_08660 [Antrihabitans sp. YC3-6]|uniref:DUF7159 domain-containing protein n=1 Tax=Antrihabitans stalagmiti TaxID=2799499 RepID=A0A934NPC2_9NOCA|nr:hypothetical protein [Antrihabitans stalagmiti]MBJ8338953.1 hypothetical protein [Antrihabitans stalagmiti]